jgi:pimeloyl-ACP methyl ester carboxylesterase
MNEKLFFVKITNGTASRKIFMHSFVNELPGQVCFIFLNSFLDRKGDVIVRKIQVDMARLLGNNNHSVFNYDYFGTGDSHGASYEMDIEKSIGDLEAIVDYVRNTFNPIRVVLFGIRLGADIAMKMAESHDELENLIIVEPVVNGKYFYRSRLFLMKTAHMLYDVKSDFHITIDGMPYENFDGIPLSQRLKNQLLELKPEAYKCRNKNILFYSFKEKDNSDLKLDIFSERNSIAMLKNILDIQNRVKFSNILIEEEGQILSDQIIPDVMQFAQIIKKTASN